MFGARDPCRLAEPADEKRLGDRGVRPKRLACRELFCIAVCLVNGSIKVMHLSAEALGGKRLVANVQMEIVFVEWHQHVKSVTDAPHLLGPVPNKPTYSRMFHGFIAVFLHEEAAYSRMRSMHIHCRQRPICDARMQAANENHKCVKNAPSLNTKPRASSENIREIIHEKHGGDRDSRDRQCKQVRRVHVPQLPVVRPRAAL